MPRRFSDYRPGNFDSGFHGPVSASDALVRSLNLPAVQVLEAYRPKRLPPGYAMPDYREGCPRRGAESVADPRRRRRVSGGYRGGVQRVRPPW
ncbi:hypothetical protein ACLK2E_13990 [Escherichia coli]